MPSRGNMLLIGLCFIASACAGSDGSIASSTITDITSVTPSQPAVSAPATPTPSAQVGADGPSLSGDAFTSDDYRSYSSTAKLQANVSVNVGGTGSPQTALYTDGPNANLAVLDPSVTYNGHPTVKYTQPGGTSTGPEMWVAFPHGKTLTNMWLRAVIRFSPGFTTLGVTPNCANAYKLLGWGWAGTNGRGGLGFTNTNQYTFTWGVESLQGVNLGFTEPTGFRSVTSEWADKGWYDYVIHYEQTSATTTRTSFYLGEGTATPTLVYVMNGAINAGNAIPQANRVMLGLNFNSQRITSQALWYGQWEVVDGSQYANPFNLN